MNIYVLQLSVRRRKEKSLAGFGFILQDLMHSMVHLLSLRFVLLSPDRFCTVILKKVQICCVCHLLSYCILFADYHTQNLSSASSHRFTWSMIMITLMILFQQCIIVTGKDLTCFPYLFLALLSYSLFHLIYSWKKTRAYFHSTVWYDSEFLFMTHLSFESSL